MPGFGARYYNPKLGRFITADPIVQAPYNPQTLNRYTYCNNNPITLIDPSGYSWWGKIWDKVEDAFHKHGGTIISVASIFVGMPYIGAILSSAWSTYINGGGYIEFGMSLGVGMLAGAAGGDMAACFARSMGMNMASIGTAVFRGVLSGMFAGAGSALILGGNVWRSALVGGAMGGAMGAAIWKLNDMRTNIFIKNHMDTSSLNAQQKTDVLKAIRESGQSPVGGRMMFRFIRAGATLTVSPESMRPDGVSLPGVADGTNSMYFDGTGKSGAQYIANESWGPTMDGAAIFSHEMGHTLSAYNQAVEPLNVAQTENLYRAWVGFPARDNYGILHNPNIQNVSQPVPYDSLIFGY